MRGVIIIKMHKIVNQPYSNVVYIALFHPGIVSISHQHEG